MAKEIDNTLADAAAETAGEIPPPDAVDVLLYADVPVGKKPTGIPDAWPAKLIEVRDLKQPVPPGYTRKTLAEYDKQRADLQPIYDAWEDAIPPTPEEVQSAVDQRTLDDLRTKPRAQWTTADTISALQAAIGLGRL